MSRSTTVTSTKSATSRANAKSTKKDKEDKPKRAPSAYNLFVQVKMKEWKENNPGVPYKEAMIEIGAMWRDAPENPNRGKTPKSKKPKAKSAEKPREAEASSEESGWYCRLSSESTLG